MAGLIIAGIVLLVMLAAGVWLMHRAETEARRNAEPQSSILIDPEED